ncbi:putative F-box/kelch-repeat protein At1g12170 [Bidens hawaiensis]|uniref:putative F-box/kelch-repeat protein At1g12170 n=1 Tax=Bidens hawaiensis TaxID=980011 RepID=UPI00404B8301
MSDSIPWDIQTEIIKRDVPVKSLIRFRSVCKQWKSLIDSSEFITHQTLNNTHQHHVLIRYSVSSEKKCVSVVDNDDDDHTFPQYNCSIPVPPDTASKVMLYSSHGLVFLFGFTLEANKLAVVWNPSIRKYVDIAPPSEATVVGFGVCPKTNDPKIFAQAQVVIDGVVLSGAYDQNAEYHQRIITFELTSEEFGEVVLPDSLVGYQCARISKLKESLAVTAYHEDPPFYDIWVMWKNYGCADSGLTRNYP